MFNKPMKRGNEPRFGNSLDDHGPTTPSSQTMDEHGDDRVISITSVLGRVRSCWIDTSLPRLQGKTQKY